MNFRIKQAVLCSAVIITVSMFYQQIACTQTGKVQELSLSEAITRIKKGEMQEIVQRPTQFDITDKNGSQYYVKIESSNDALKNTVILTAIENGVHIRSEEGDNYLWAFVVGYLPILVFMGFWIVIVSVIVWLAKRNNITNSKQCPYCAERIQVAAKVCRFCGKDLAI